MSTTRFVCNDALWSEVDAHVKRAGRVRAAVAYMGKGGARLLPLRRGDKLVVDMSLGAVRQGVTDPREIQKLMKKGVEVFSRRSLHTKFYVIDDTLIAGSANVSRNSQTMLDEAGVITTDRVAVRRARAFFDDKLAVEPVRDRYLKTCIRAYRSPRFKAAADSVAGPSERGKRAVEAKVWFIGGLAYIQPPASERKKIEAAERRAENRLKRPDKTFVDWLHYHYRPQYFDHIQTGDWVVSCIRDKDGTREVQAPEQVIADESYERQGRKRRHLLMLECPDGADIMPLVEFRRRIRRVVPVLDQPAPRTRPIVDTAQQDAILALWTPAGRISRKRTRRS